MLLRDRRLARQALVKRSQTVVRSSHTNPSPKRPASAVSRPSQRVNHSSYQHLRIRSSACHRFPARHGVRFFHAVGRGMDEGKVTEPNVESPPEWRSGLNALRKLGVPVHSVGDMQALDSLFSFGHNAWVKGFCDHVRQLQVHFLSQTLMKGHVNSTKKDVELGAAYVYEWLVEQCFNTGAFTDSSRKSDLVSGMTEDALALFRFLDEPRALFKEMNLRPHIEIEPESISASFLRFGVHGRRRTPGIFMGLSAILGGVLDHWRQSRAPPDGTPLGADTFTLPVECVLEVNARQRLRLLPLHEDSVLSEEAQGLVDLEPDYYNCTHILSLGAAARYRRSGSELDSKAYPPAGSLLSLWALELPQFSSVPLSEKSEFLNAWREKDAEVTAGMQQLVDVTEQAPPSWKLCDFDNYLTWYGIPG